MLLKHSLADWCYLHEGMDPAEYYPRVKAAGFEAVEMVVPAHRSMARAAGLEILNLSGPGMEKGLNNSLNHAFLIPEIVKAINEAAAEDMRHVIIFSGNRFGPDDDKGLGECVDAIRRLLPTAEHAGVTLVFEMLNSFDHANYQADKSGFGFDLVRTIGSPYLKILYDIYHMHRMGEDVMDDLLNNIDLIAHLHIAGSPNRNFPGAHQAIDYGAIIPAVQEAGYEGFWGQEFIPAGDPVQEAVDALGLLERAARAGPFRNKEHGLTL